MNKVKITKINDCTPLLELRNSEQGIKNLENEQMNVEANEKNKKTKILSFLFKTHISFEFSAIGFVSRFTINFPVSLGW